MTVKTGNANTPNVISGIGSAMVTTRAALENFRDPFQRGSMLYTTDDGRLVVGDGTTPPASLPDHKHAAYAPVVHSHTYINNDAWLPSTPKLWYRDDLEHHPELIALDGQEIPADQANILSQYYPGSMCITEPCTSFSINGDSNDAMIVTGSSSSDYCIPGRVFGDPIEIEDIAKTLDQWIIGTAGADAILTIVFKNGFTYVPTEYWMIPAAGTMEAPLKSRPTPNTWRFEGSIDNGNTWTTIDSHEGVTENWIPLAVTKFTFTNSTAYNALRLVITSWNGVADETLLGGLRRFWVFGHKEGTFLLPKLEAPSDEFAWVVPFTSSNQGLRHEDIGDLGISSCLPENLSAYRLKADGSVYNKSTYPTLFASIGYTNDKVLTNPTVVTSSGVFSNDVYEAVISGSETLDPVYLEFDGNNECLGRFEFINNGGSNTPMSFLVEGYTSSTDTYTTITQIIRIPNDDFVAANGNFFLDTNITDTVYDKIRITITEWHELNSTVDLTIRLYTHPKDKFYIPDLSGVAPEGCFYYIVANNTASDVSSLVISELQANVATLTELVAASEGQGVINYTGELYEPDA